MPELVVTQFNYIYHMKWQLFLTLSVLAFRLNSQVPIDTAGLKQQLKTIYDRDQKTRTGADSAEFVNFIDSTNLVYVEDIIAQYGWPGISFVGKEGNRAVFLVIQHADLETQLKYISLLRESVQKNESNAFDLAMMEDRILMRQNKKQIYGSQVVSDDETGGWKFYPIEDEINVNERRKSVGLMPIEEYAKLFGIIYVPPKN
jgi:hypothetical protein